MRRTFNEIPAKEIDETNGSPNELVCSCITEQFAPKNSHGPSAVLSKGPSVVLSKGPSAVLSMGPSLVLSKGPSMELSKDLLPKTPYFGMRPSKMATGVENIWKLES